MTIRLYFVCKGERNVKIIDNKIGWGDIILLFAFGCTLVPETLVFFFTIVFILSVVFHIIISKWKDQIPLAAYLLILYNIYVAAVL